MITTTTTNAIRSRFKAQIADPHSLVTQYDNQDMAKPDLPWCRLSILDGESFQTEIVRGYRTAGVMIAQLFYPLGTGDKAARIMAAHIEDAFKSVSISGTQFQTPSVKTIGRRDDSWQVNVTCPFYVNE